MAYTIEKRILPESNILFMRRRVQRSEISTALGELLGGAFGHAMKTGAALAGPPLCRYREMNAGGMTLEAGVAVAVPAAGEGDVLAGTLPAGVRSPRRFTAGRTTRSPTRTPQWRRGCRRTA